MSLESGHRVVWTSEDNYKFRLSQFQQPLLDWYSSPDRKGMYLERWVVMFVLRVTFNIALF